MKAQAHQLLLVAQILLIADEVAAHHPHGADDLRRHLLFLLKSRKKSKAPKPPCSEEAGVDGDNPGVMWNQDERLWRPKDIQFENRVPTETTYVRPLRNKLQG